MLKIESTRLFPRSHEDADMQDVGGTNSGKHYERTCMMACQQMQERQILYGIYKGSNTLSLQAYRKRQQARACLKAGAGKGTAHHHRHGQPFKVQHDLPCVTEAHWLVPKRRKRKITTHQPPVPSEASGGNILKESLKFKIPKHMDKSSLTHPFRNTSAFGWIFRT